jgi:hypothetical protein
MIPHQALILWRMLTAAYGTFRTYLDVRVESEMRSKADIENEKAQRWGTGLNGNISRSAIGATLSAGQSSCLYNIEHRHRNIAVFPRPLADAK